MRTVAVAVSLLLATLSAQAPKPLPDAQVFMREVRARLQPDEDRQRDYAYVETRRQIRVDRSGAPTGETVKVFESYPGLPGQPRWLRLVSQNGKPVPADERAREDRKRQEKAEAFLRAAARRTPAEQARFQREQERKRQETREMVDDVFRAFELRMTGRETLDGYDVIAIALAPRPDADTRTRIGSMLRHFRGRAWVSEPDYELMRIEVEAIRGVNLGFGFLARVQPGARFAFERRKVDDGVWMPARAAYHASARVLLLKGMQLNGVSEYSGYRRFTVQTSAAYGTPAAPASPAGRSD